MGAVLRPWTHATAAHCGRDWLRRYRSMVRKVAWFSTHTIEPGPRAAGVTGSQVRGSGRVRIAGATAGSRACKRRHPPRSAHRSISPRARQFRGRRARTRTSCETPPSLISTAEPCEPAIVTDLTVRTSADSSAAWGCHCRNRPSGGLRESGGRQISGPPASKNASTTHNAVSKPGQPMVVNEKQRCALLQSRCSHAAAV